MKRNALILACFALALTASAANAQPTSHLPIPGWGGAGSDPLRARQMREQIEGKFGQGRTTPTISGELIERALEMLKNKTPEQIDDLKRQFEQNPGLADQFRNPEFKRDLDRRIEERHKNEPARSGNGTRADELKNMVGELNKRDSSANRNSNPTGGPPPNSGARPANPMPPQQQTPVDPSAPAPKPSRFDPRERSPSTRDDAGAERFKEFVRRAERWMPQSMKDSEAAKNLTRKLADRDWGKSSSKLFDKLGSKIDVGDGLKGTGNFLERAFNRVGNRRMPNINAPNLPSAPRGPSLGTPGTPSGAEMGGAFTVLLVLAVVLIGGLMIWKLLVQPARARTPKTGDWHPGSWPVDPSRVRTREELIQAFDHLALLRGGQVARHWHHDQVAKQFGDDESQRVVANRVADIYELARYTPPQEPLAAERITAAGADIGSLAGQS